MEYLDPTEKDGKKILSITEKKMASKPSVKDWKKDTENVSVVTPETEAVSSALTVGSTNFIPPPSPVLPPQAVAPMLPPPSFPSSSYPVPGQFLPCGTDMSLNFPHASSQGSSQMLQTSAMQSLTSYVMSSSYMNPVPPPLPAAVVDTFPAFPAKESVACAAPIKEGKGMTLMKKMGWNPGEGLGKNKEGAVEPLVLRVKKGKKGLISKGEEQQRKNPKNPFFAYCHKHPVSVLAELCSERKWSPPIYTLMEEDGPSHKRLFLFKVSVNNVEYQPKKLCANKKLAKAQTAALCLSAVGIPASEYIMPT